MLTAATAMAAPYEDRLVWLFGWGLQKEADLADMVKIMDDGARHGLNGVVFGGRLDPLCKKDDAFFRRLDQLRAAGEERRMEFIPALFSVGYGGSLMAHDSNLAEGLPVADALFEVQGAEARFVPSGALKWANGDFEAFQRNRFGGFNFHDQPGEISFADTQIKHSGRASMRLENFTANPHGHARVMQEVKLRPRACYRLSLWVKTENLQPAGAFRLIALAGKRDLATRQFKIPSTTDWIKISTLFNSLDQTAVRVYAGLWGGQSGKIWLDDWQLEEAGPYNVLRRPGTPVTVRAETGGQVYEEGRDYAPLADHNRNLYNVDRAPASLKIPPGSRIAQGQKLRVSWYHPLVINDSQVTVCMGEPALYEIFEHEAKLLAEKVKPKRVFLNMDEVRMGGTCRACEGRDMAQLIGECVTRQVRSLRRHLPGAQVYVWSDMFDPHHNARPEYYLVRGDYTGSWKHIPKDLVIAVWGGAPREKSLKFFADQGFQTLVACYYDADDLRDVQAWLDLASRAPNVRGFMYTPWQKKYALLPEFGDLLKK